MDTNNILERLRAERARINKAILVLEGSSGNGRRGKRQGRLAAADGRRGRRLSAAARKKISDAAKRRWANAKKSRKASLAKA